MKSTTKTNPLMTAPREDVYGFHGTMKTDEGLTEAEAQATWECAMEAVMKAAKCGAPLARNFLRSRHGRHFADATSLHEGALPGRIRQAAAETWITLALAHLSEEALFKDDPAGK